MTCSPSVSAVCPIPSDFTDLLHAVGDRIPDVAIDIEESVPRVFIPFPTCSDPVRETDSLNPNPDDEWPARVLLHNAAVHHKVAEIGLICPNWVTKGRPG